MCVCELTMRLLKDPQGPAITVHLSNNVTELAKLQNMEYGEAVDYIATTIKPAIAAGRQERTSQDVPPPLSAPKQTVVPDSDDADGLAGATFE